VAIRRSAGKPNRLTAVLQAGVMWALMVRQLRVSAAEGSAALLSEPVLGRSVDHSGERVLQTFSRALTEIDPIRCVNTRFPERTGVATTDDYVNPETWWTWFVNRRRLSIDTPPSLFFDARRIELRQHRSESWLPQHYPQITDRNLVAASLGPFRHPSLRARRVGLGQGCDTRVTRSESHLTRPAVAHRHDSSVRDALEAGQYAAVHPFMCIARFSSRTQRWSDARARTNPIMATRYGARCHR